MPVAAQLEGVATEVRRVADSLDTLALFVPKISGFLERMADAADAAEKRSDERRR